VRLTAADGYSTQRPYSIASAPEDPRIELSVEHLEAGEVSPHLAGELREGDAFEIRGPGGRAFSWHAQDGRPLLLVAGGAGLAPLRAIVRHRLAQGSDVPTHAVVSARTRETLLYGSEVDAWAAAGVHTHVALTREPGGRRLDLEQLAAAGPPPAGRPHVFVCGPTRFVEHVTSVLQDLGHDPALIRAERFGGSE
jgi:ferredoxin-NADP reductase